MFQSSTPVAFSDAKKKQAKLFEYEEKLCAQKKYSRGFQSNALVMTHYGIVISSGTRLYYGKYLLLRVKERKMRFAQRRKWTLPVQEERLMKLVRSRKKVLEFLMDENSSDFGGYDKIAMFILVTTIGDDEVVALDLL